MNEYTKFIVGILEFKSDVHEAFSNTYLYWKTVWFENQSLRTDNGEYNKYSRNI
jgi:hypothetical protein